MLNNKIVCLLITFFSFSFAGFSQSPQDTIWNLQECIDYALKNNIQIKQSELNAISKRVYLDQSKADFLPSVNAGTTVSYNVGRSIDPFTNQYKEQPITSQNLYLQGSLTLFNGFQKINNYKKNQLDFHVAEYNLQDNKNTVVMNLVSYYTQVLFNKELLLNSRSRLSTTQLQLARTEKLVSAGAKAQSDLLEIQAQTATDELEVVKAQNQLDLSELYLKQVLQLPAENDFDIESPQLKVNFGAQYPESLETVYGTALSTQASVKSADLAVHVSDYNILSYRANGYPSLTLSGGLGSRYSSVAPSRIPKAGSKTLDLYVPVGYLMGDSTKPVLPLQPQSIPTEFVTNTYWNQMDVNYNRYVQLNLNIPLFNNWQTRTTIATAKISRDNARLNAVSVRNQLRQNIEKSYLDIKTASKTYTATENKVRSLQESFRSAEQRFNLGVINAVDYNQIKNQYDQAQSDLLRAKYDYIFKTKILDFYQGKPLTF